MVFVLEKRRNSYGVLFRDVKQRFALRCSRLENAIPPPF